MVKQLGVKTKQLKFPRKVKNVDGTYNKAGRIMEAAILSIKFKGKESKHCFLVADVGDEDIILGYPFLEDFYPDIDWQQGTLGEEVTISTNDTEEWKPRPRTIKRRLNDTPAWVRLLPGWEEGDEVWLRTTINKVTVVQQLAEKATDKTKKTWQEQVPSQYHVHGQVFLEQVSKIS